MNFCPPAESAAVLAAFAPLFTRPTWARAQTLLCGVLLTPGAGVRRRLLWRQMGLCLSAAPTEMRKPAGTLFTHLTELLCYAA